MNMTTMLIMLIIWWMLTYCMLGEHTMEAYYGSILWKHSMAAYYGSILCRHTMEACYGINTMRSYYGVLLRCLATVACYGFQLWGPAMGFSAMGFSAMVFQPWVYSYDVFSYGFPIIGFDVWFCQLWVFRERGFHMCESFLHEVFLFIWVFDIRAFSSHRHLYAAHISCCQFNKLSKHENFLNELNQRVFDHFLIFLGQRLRLLIFLFPNNLFLLISFGRPFSSTSRDRFLA